MKNNPSRTRNLIIIAVVVIALVFAYFYEEGGSSASNSSLLVSQPSTQSIGSSELSLLDQIQSLKIDPSLFQDPAYQTLQDYSVPIPQDGVGRPNPFAPFPGENISSSGAASGGTPVTGGAAGPTSI